ncbi:hypothetical protein DSO57_1033621 [Entomophthora muscae]|uniref:Uncharacterized protein n=1 Tax=Entomophthora muscae TaxID=34485 RepID=A0ACC2TMG9_9FUNG|nr:hypothetical protein DSO57_1033621 [Entomophthora muscae]
MSEATNDPTITLTSFTGKKCIVHSNYRGQLESVDNYDRISTLGEGTYGLVSLASEMSTGKIRAIKALKEQHGRDLDICVLRETKLLSSLRHPNIIGLYGVLAGSSIKKTYLMMEICQQDLDRYLRDKKNFLPSFEIRDLFSQLLKGLDFLHRASIIHRDLKPANILLSKDGVLKIADFGMARLLAPQTSGAMTPGVVTLWYRAPELLLSCPDYSYAVDMWSAGCILAELCLLNPVLQGETELGQLHLICDLLGSPTSIDTDHLARIGVPSSTLSMIPKDRPRLMRLQASKRNDHFSFRAALRSINMGFHCSLYRPQRIRVKLPIWTQGAEELNHPIVENAYIEDFSLAAIFLY